MHFGAISTSRQDTPISTLKASPHAMLAFAGAKHAYHLEGVDSFVEGWLKFYLRWNLMSSSGV